MVTGLHVDSVNLTKFTTTSQLFATTTLRFIKWCNSHFFTTT